jgi:hypothetical protein
MKRALAPTCVLASLLVLGACQGAESRPGDLASDSDAQLLAVISSQTL